MNYTQSDANVVHAGTGHRMHQDAAPVTTAVSAADMNQVIWSLMKVVETAGLSGIDFDPATPATYSRFLTALQTLFSSTVLSSSGVPYGFKVGNVIVQIASQAFANVPVGAPGTTGTITFTTAFPTACLAVFPMTEVTAGQDSNFHPSITAKTTTTCSYQVQEWANTVNPGTLVVLAIGY